MQPIKHSKQHVYLKITVSCDRFLSSVMVTAVRVSSATSLKQNVASNITALRCAGLAMNVSQETSPHKKLKYLQEKH